MKRLGLRLLGFLIRFLILAHDHHAWGASPFPRKVSLAPAFRQIKEPWSPHVAADVNEFQVKLARMEGDFVWHHHTDEDELFLVLKGQMKMKFRRRVAHGKEEGAEAGEGGDWEMDEVDVGEQECIVVPKGVEHCPCAVTESCDVVLLERSTTLNTGSAAEDIDDFVHEKSKQGISLTKRELNRIQ
jgi:mannose-6-phosphate isomerase-like protein (cupin superfamily)